MIDQGEKRVEERRGLEREDSIGVAALKAVHGLGRSPFLDPAVRGASRLAGSLLRPERLKRLLAGTWLGHGFHPLLTDLTEGPWMAASFLDVFGHEDSKPAARRLLAFGLLMALPTHLSGLAEWTGARAEGERRLGLVHGGTAFLATLLYATSYLARRRGAERAGVALGLAGGMTALLDGYVGGHLSHGWGVAVGETLGVRNEAGMGGNSEV